MASKGTGETGQNFTIRFNPSLVQDDDDDDDLGFDSHKPKKEVLQFELTSISKDTDKMKESDTSRDTETSDQSLPNGQAIPPSSLWKSINSQAASKSAPASEVSSPLASSKSIADKSSSVIGKDNRAVSKAQDKKQEKCEDQEKVPEKSIFSGLKHKLARVSAESKEIFDRRVLKTGLSESSKNIPAEDANEPDIIEKEMKDLKPRSRSGSDVSNMTIEKLMTMVKSSSSESLDENSDILQYGHESFPAITGSSVRKSSSMDQMSKREESNFISESQSYSSDIKRVSDLYNSTEISPINTDSVTMSALLTGSTSSLQSEDAVTGEADDANKSKIRLLPLSTPAHSRKSKFMQQGKVSSWRFIPARPEFSRSWKFFAGLVALVAYVAVPLPSYAAGMVTGSTLAAVFMLVYQWWTSPRTTLTSIHQEVKPNISTSIPEMKESKNTEGVFKGWMNELSLYNPEDYHINLTHSVFVTLEGTTLRLQTPRQGIPKRALWNEDIPSTVNFVRQRHYDLSGSEVILLPADLIRKRLWSKKYPICIRITKRPLGELQEKPPREFGKQHSLVKTDSNSESPNSGRKMVESKTESGLLTLKENESKQHSNIKQLFLFTRSSREKEEWYRRFASAAAGTPWPTRFSDLVLKSPVNSKMHRRSASNYSLDQAKRRGSTDSNTSVESGSVSGDVDYSKTSPEVSLLHYIQYMAKIMPSGDKSNSRSRSVSPTELTKTEETSENSTPTSPSSDDQCEPQILWLNALISRCFLDFLREKYWVEKIRDKIQKKLLKIHVPHFIDRLTVTGIDLGSQVPVIQSSSRPYLDDRGLWIDLDINYGGGFCITMETKCNLMKLKLVSTTSSTVDEHAEKRSAAKHSDEEDSAESTTDEEGAEENGREETDDKRAQPIGKRLLRFVDMISQSKYFQQATEYKYIKKAMEEVSNTRLLLNVEMKSVQGTLSINIPPPPSDRLWYGFRGNPKMILVARPRVGEREVSLSHITDWIEKKLALEFQRVFVMPNMDDLEISLMVDHIQS